MFVLGIFILLIQAGLITAILKAALNGNWIYTFIFSFILVFFNLLSRPKNNIDDLMQYLKNKDN